MSTSTPDLTPGERQSRSAVRGHILFCVGILLALYITWHLAKELEIIYVSALFAVVLSPIVLRITKFEVRGRRPSRGIAIAILIAAVILALSIFFTFGLPPVLRDLRQFSTELPQRIPEAVERIDKLPFASRFNIDSVIQRAEGALTASASYLFASLPGWLSHVFDILAAVFLCVYFMLEGEYAYRFFLSLFPYQERTRLDTTLRRADLKISKWLFGQGLLMLILGVSSTIAFGFLHVRYFLLLGVLMGLFNIIPIAGGIVTMILVTGVAALDSWTKMAGVLIFYAIYVNIENAYLTPRIMRSSVNLMGLTVLIALLCGTALAGVVGALVAVPTAALVTVLLDEYAVQKEWR
ncbi:MAG: AI-2E family transporter [Edaphobacter sp.]